MGIKISLGTIGLSIGRSCRGGESSTYVFAVLVVVVF